MFCTPSPELVALFWQAVVCLEGKAQLIEIGCQGPTFELPLPLRPDQLPGEQLLSYLLLLPAILPCLSLMTVP